MTEMNHDGNHSVISAPHQAPDELQAALAREYRYARRRRFWLFAAAWLLVIGGTIYFLLSK
jgi:hypothetical protein